MTSGGNLTSIQWSRGGRATRLIGNQTTQLTYGAQDQLVTKTVDGTRSRYFGKRFVKVGGTWRERIVAQGEVIAMVKTDVGKNRDEEKIGTYHNLWKNRDVPQFMNVYDANGNLAISTDVDTVAVVPAVNARGAVQAWTLGNGVDVRREHNPATGAVSVIMAGPSHNASLVSLAYGYGPLGNVGEAYDVLTGRGFKLAGTSHDALSRLIRFNMYSHAESIASQ